MARIRPRNDDGIAMVAAIAVVMLVTLLMGSLVAVAMTEARQSGRDRQRSSAVMTAEGGVDTTFARMQGSSLTALPCGDTVTAGGSAADTLTVATTVTYYDAAGNVLTCPLAANASVTQAVVQATSTTNALANQAPAKRTMEALVQLTPSYGLNKAIFGNAGIVAERNTDVYGSEPARSDGDVYSNGNISCTSGTYRGSVVTQGSIALNGCNAVGTAWARTGVTASSTSIGGVAVSAGDVNLADSTAVTNVVRASGTIRDTSNGTWAGCSVLGKCAPGSTVDAPPAEPFPQLPYNATTVSKWVAAGYSPTIVTNNSCAGEPNGPAQWLEDDADDITVPTILRTTCQINFKNHATVNVSDNVVVFADGGWNAKNSVEFTSTNSTLRYVYIVQPYGSVAMPCTIDGIDMKNGADVTPTVNLLLYSPCNISVKNTSVIYGQVYSGGTVTAKQNLDVYFRPLPVYGLVNTEPTFDLDIMFKRETESP